MVQIEPGDIAELIHTGQFEEGVELEAKRASGNVPKNAWESISAFANTRGGVLVLGLCEDGDGWKAEGVGDAGKMIRDLHTAMRDRNKISREVSGNDDIWREEVDGASLVVVRVQPAPRRHKPVYINSSRDQAYLRRNEADSKCRDEELDRMRREAMPSTYDNEVVPYLNVEEHFDAETIISFRKLSLETNPSLAHHRQSQNHFLQNIGAWRKDYERNVEGATVAGILMFGTEIAIREIRSNHIIDWRRVPAGSPTPRWTDRVHWRGNLFGAYEAIFPRLSRGLPVPFRLRGPQRIDQPAGLETLREAFINLLVHTDYREFSDAVILHRDDGYTFRNPGDSWFPVEDLGKQQSRERRNPTLVRMFNDIGFSDQSGGGYIDIFREWKELGYRKPSVVSDPERYEFVLELSLGELIAGEDRQWLNQLGGPWRQEEELALLFAYRLEYVDNQTLRSATGQHLFDTSLTLRSLRDRGLLEQHGAGRSTYYVLGSATKTGTGHLPESTGHLPESTDHLPESTDHLPESTDHLPDENRVQTDLEIKRIAEPVASTGKASAEDVKIAIVSLCTLIPMSTEELAQALDRRTVTIRRYLRELITTGELEPIHSQSRHPDQRYRAKPKPTGAEEQTSMQL